jgi:hypothetical protein
VCFSISLPSYDESARGRFERQADRNTNDRTFSKAIAELFKALKTIDAGDGSRPITLRLLKTESVSDHNAWYNPMFRAGEEAGAKIQYLRELRYRDSFIQLLDAESLPQLYNVDSLMIYGVRTRKLASTTFTKLISRLPKIISTGSQFWDRERRRPDKRRQLRSDLAEQLITLSAPRHLQRLRLSLDSKEPANSNFADADVRGSLYPPHIDDLSTALRLFSQGAPCLVYFELNGPIAISPEIFLPPSVTQHDTEQRWRVLEDFVVSLSAVRPDGGWYVELDPERDTDSSDEEEKEDIWQENDDNSEYGYRSGASSSSYDSSDSFFATDQLPLPPDSYGYEDEMWDMRLNGDEPFTSRFRTKPTLELEALFLAAAIAASQMPMLKHMRVGLEIGPSGRTNQRSRILGFEYRTAVDLDSSNQAGRRGGRRLHWHVPRDWRMNERLESQWMSLIGDDDIIEYDEW